jgi:hypothetical protein
MGRLKHIRNARTGMDGSVVRGFVIYAPVNARVGIGGVGQDVNTVSDTQRYELGTRLVTGDGRVFRYGKCGASVDSTKFGLKNWNILVTEKASIVSACAAGATSLTVTFDGDFWDVALAANELYGGYISLYNSSSIRDTRMIISNTAVTTAGGACTIGIDEPIVTAVAATFNCEVMTNPYSDLRSINNAETSVMGMPAALPTTGQYFWIQTWGPYRVTPTAAELGTIPEDRQYVFDNAGSVYSHQLEHDRGICSYQHAGFLIERTDGVAGSAAPFIMLQISP